MRVYALAKALDVETKTLLDLCRDLGYDAKNQLSSLDEAQCAEVKRRLSAPPPTPAPVPDSLPTRVAAATATLDNRVRNLAPARPRPAAPAPTPAAPAPAAVPSPAAPVVQVAAPVAPAAPPVVTPGPVAVVARPPAPVVAPPAVTAAPVVPPPVVAPVEAVAHAVPVLEPTPAVAVVPPAPPVAVAVAEKPTPIAPVVPAAPVAPVVLAPAPAPVVAPPTPAAAPVLTRALTDLNRPRNLDSRPRNLSAPPARPAPAPAAPVAPVAPPVAPASVAETPAPVVPPAPPSRTGLVSPATRPAVSQPTPPAAVPPRAGMPNAPIAPARPGAPGAPLRSGPPSGPSGPSGNRPMSGNPSGPSGNRPIGSGAIPGGARRPADPNRRPGPLNGAPGQPPAGGPRPPAGPGPVKQTSLANLTPEMIERMRRGEAVNLNAPPPPAPRPVGDRMDRPSGPGGPGMRGPDRFGPPGGPSAFAPPGAGGGSAPNLGEDRRPGGAFRPGAPGGPGTDRDKQRATPDRNKGRGGPAGRGGNVSVVVRGGQVDVVENESRYRSGGRKGNKIKAPVTLPRKSGKTPITLPITVRSLSEAIGMKTGELLLKLRVLGLTATINSNLDTDTAELLATERGCELDIRKPQDAEDELIEEHEQEEDPSRLHPRAPVVTIMGHVDHGKTSLLDRIRKSNVVDTEAGGITQVIRAWQVVHNGNPITFLDTPGHEAFTKMRARGANVTDIAVIVCAATDGVRPQTEEAISHAKAAGVAMVVAINKVDMPNANLKKTEQQLYSLGVLPDNMGGDTPFVYTSATTGQGIEELLEQILLVAELKELRANPARTATGVCLEAKLSGDEGVFATVLVQQGTLHRGDVILCGAAYGRVRAMYNDMGKLIKEAGPSTPVRITGLDVVPDADDPFHVMTELSKAREIAEKRQGRLTDASMNIREPMRLESLGQKKIAELKIILKAEARGSVEAIRKELEKLTHDEVRVRVLHAAIGGITESDVQLALTSPDDTLVVGFNVVPDDGALRLAEARGISIREYDIIYKLTDDIKSALEGKLKPMEQVVHLGRAVVRESFKISKVGTIAGCHVTQGTIERSAKVRIIRDGSVIYPPAERTASLESLKRFKDDTREVREGFDCGMKIAGFDDIKVGDVIEAYRIDIVQRTL